MIAAGYPVLRHAQTPAPESLGEDDKGAGQTGRDGAWQPTVRGGSAVAPSRPSFSGSAA